MAKVAQVMRMNLKFIMRLLRTWYRKATDKNNRLVCYANLPCCCHSISFEHDFVPHLERAIIVLDNNAISPVEKGCWKQALETVRDSIPMPLPWCGMGEWTRDCQRMMNVVDKFQEIAYEGAEW